MTTIRSSGVEVTQQCKEIQEKIDLTSTKISSSMTSLNELINNKHNDTKLIAKVRSSICPILLFLGLEKTEARNEQAAYK